ncbi:TPA: hypothetical protein SB711_001713, partial [Campylobacter jejuni]|nr:hypothetical protein [Campylobacter jejuni]
VLSLATISFLASCANATLTPEIKTYDEVNKNTKARSASVYTPEARIDTTVSGSISNQINITDQGPHTIIIQSGGTLGSTGNNNKIIYAHASGSNTLTLANLTNKGTINGNVNVEHDNNFNGTITVNTFENKNQINGQIYMGIWGGNSGTLNVDKFDNSGTIASNSQGVFFEGKNTNIQTFINAGTIISSGNQDATDGSTLNISSGVQMRRGYIETFNNEGLLSGKFGINLVGSTINNFKNTGTIEGTSTHQYGSAINLSGVSDDISIIKTFENEGTIKSVQANGISIGDGNKIETLINKGTIEAGLNGISFFAFGGYQKPIELGKITLEEGSSIKAGNNGIHIDGSDEGIKSDAIEVKQGAKIEGGKSGIYLGGGKEINTQITIAGEVSGGAAGIVNEGVIGGSTSSGNTGGIIISGGSVSSSSGGSGIVNQGNGSINGEIKVESGGSVEGGITNTGSGSISGNIVVENGGKLDSITNTSTSDTGISGSITNNSDNKLEISNGEGATIGGGITNNGNADLVISNQGSVGKDENGNTVTNNGSGSVGIKDWVVSTDKNTGKLDTVVVGGSGKDNVKVENITVDQSNVNLDELGNINNIISGVNQNNIGNIGTNG